MRAILILGVILMPWLDDMRAVSGAIAQPAAAKQARDYDWRKLRPEDLPNLPFPGPGQEYSEETRALDRAGVRSSGAAAYVREEREQHRLKMEEYNRLKSLGLPTGKKPVPRFPP